MPLAALQVERASARSTVARRAVGGRRGERSATFSRAVSSGQRFRSGRRSRPRGRGSARARARPAARVTSRRREPRRRTAGRARRRDAGRALARAGRAEQRDDLARLDAQVETAQRDGLDRPRAEDRKTSWNSSAPRRRCARGVRLAVEAPTSSGSSRSSAGRHRHCRPRGRAEIDDRAAAVVPEVVAVDDQRHPLARDRVGALSVV